MHQNKPRLVRGNNASAIDSGGSGGGNDMEARIAKLETSVGEIKVDVAVIKSNYAKTSDVSDATTSLIKWIVGTMLAAAGLAATIAFGLAKLTSLPF